MENYFQTRDEINLHKIDCLLSELPEYVGQFIIGISSRTSVLTRLNYTRDIKVFLNYLSKYKFNRPADEITLSDIEHLTPYDIERYIDYLSMYRTENKKNSCGDKAKERKLAALRSFYKYLFKKELIQTNATLKVDMPKIHDKPIIRLESDEVGRLIGIASDGNTLSARQRASNEITRARDLAILYTFLGTGIRVSELVGLNKSDIDFENDSFTVTRKGGNKSILYLPEETSAAIKNYLEWLDDQMSDCTEFGRKLALADPDVLFYSLQAKRIGVRAVENLVKKYAGYAAPLKKITPHKLRSTYATNLYRATEDIYVVADVLGHSDVNTTKRHYAQMSEENRRKAAKITKIADAKHFEEEN